MTCVSEMEPTEPPSEWDLALFQAIRRVLQRHGPDAANLEHTWSDRARMWFVEATPVNDRAANFSAAFNGRDLVTVTAGKTSFEVPVEQLDEMNYIADMADAVFSGHLEEVERGGMARLTTPDGHVMRVGYVHLPIPWRLRRRYTYPAYAPGR